MISRIQISNAMTVEHLQTILLDRIKEIRSKQITNMKLKNLTNTNSNNTKKTENNLFIIDDLNAGDVFSGTSVGDDMQPLHEFTRQLVAEGIDERKTFTLMNLRRH